MKRIWELLVGAWDAIFGVREMRKVELPAQQPMWKVEWNADYDKNPPIGYPPVKTPVPPMPEPPPPPVVEVASQFRFNPYTGMLSLELNDLFDSERPHWIPVPESLNAIASAKLNGELDSYIRFADHRSAIGKWASQIRRDKGILYDRNTVATQNKAIKALAKAQKRSK